MALGIGLNDDPRVGIELQAATQAHNGIATITSVGAVHDSYISGFVPVTCHQVLKAPCSSILQRHHRTASQSLRCPTPSVAHLAPSLLLSNVDSPTPWPTPHLRHEGTSGRRGGASDGFVERALVERGNHGSSSLYVPPFVAVYARAGGAQKPCIQSTSHRQPRQATKVNRGASFQLPFRGPMHTQITTKCNNTTKNQTKSKPTTQQRTQQKESNAPSASKSSC